MDKNKILEEIYFFINDLHNQRWNKDINQLYLKLSDFYNFFNKKKAF